MTAQVQPLFPLNKPLLAIRGLYLNEDIHSLGSIARPFVYANFVSSLDGRIALPAVVSRNRLDSNWQVPTHLTSKSDWILFQELQAHAECLITHAGYLRALARGQHGNILQIGASTPDTYLQSWRSVVRLCAQPKIVVVSRTLDFSLPHSWDSALQSMTVITGNCADVSRINQLRSCGVTVYQNSSKGWVSAAEVYTVLQQLQIRTAYLQTGPDLLHSMIQHGLLQRLYLTQSLSLVGGDPALSMVSGSTLDNRARLQLRALYLLHSHASNDNGHSAYNDESEQQDQQLFASFDVNYSSAGN